MYFTIVKLLKVISNECTYIQNIQIACVQLNNKQANHFLNVPKISMDITLAT